MSDIIIRFKNCAYNLADLSEKDKELMKDEIAKETLKLKKAEHSKKEDVKLEVEQVIEQPKKKTEKPLND